MQLYLNTVSNLLWKSLAALIPFPIVTANFSFYSFNKAVHFPV